MTLGGGLKRCIQPVTGQAVCHVLISDSGGLHTWRPQYLKYLVFLISYTGRYICSPQNDLAGVEDGVHDIMHSKNPKPKSSQSCP